MCTYIWKWQYGNQVKLKIVFVITFKTTIDTLLVSMHMKPCVVKCILPIYFSRIFYVHPMFFCSLFYDDISVAGLYSVDNWVARQW
jgi:hypothetical protein